MLGNCLFEHCYFSGPIVKTKSGSFSNIFPVKDIFSTTTFLLIVPFLITILAVIFIFYYRKQVFRKINFADDTKLSVKKN
jgi:hypothetical protein